MAKGIFISYRHEDSPGYAGRLHENLVRSLPDDQIFRDIVTIEPGSDFVEAINKAVDGCAALLVVIGPEWLKVTTKDGERRIDLPKDFIRLEVGTALRRGVRVIPVLVDGAKMPSAEDLPAEFEPLSRRQAYELSESRWSYDLNGLVDALEKVPGVSGRRPEHAAPPAPPAKSGSPLIKVGIGIAAVVAVVVIASISQKPNPRPEPEPVPGGGGVVPGGEPIPAPERTPLRTDPVPRPTPAQEDPPRPKPSALDSLEQTEWTPPAMANSIPNFAGTWLGADGLIYRLDQAGTNVVVAIFEPQSSTVIGGGQGVIQGQILNTSVVVATIYGQVTAQASLSLGPGGTSIQGTAMDEVTRQPQGVFLTLQGR